ncbi:MAG: isopentenyl-diphosphate Delta-isomerase [Bacteroidota bacterium]
MKEELVILVDNQDQEVGVMEKMQAHREGLLHRAFSVFIFDQQDNMLLHQRAFEKYHSGGLWTNACCSHPRPGESVQEAADRRLMEEMGFHCSLNPSFSFIYQTEFDNGLTEHELDHVFVGEFDGEPRPEPSEVAAWKFVSLEYIQAQLKQQPQDYTVWFRIAFEKLMQHSNKLKQQ